MKNKISKIKERIFKNAYNKDIFMNIIGTVFVKGCSIIVSLFMMPVFIHYFNNQTILGLWFTILSFLNWFTLFDLGLGNGLRNKLTESIAIGDLVSGKKYISSAYIIVGIFSVIACITSFFIFPYINWNIIFNVEENIINHNVLLYSVQIIFIGIFIQFFLKLISSILFAMQKSALNNFLLLISNLLILIYILFFNSGSITQNLISLSFVNVFAVNAPLLFTTFVIFNNKLKQYRPSLKGFDIHFAKSIFNMGISFFILQLAAVVIGGTNEFLISKFVKPSYVVEYQIYNKIFGLFNTLFNLALTPIWSAVTKALYENNILWIKNMHFMLCKVSLVFGFGLFAIIPLIQNIINLWLGISTIEIKVTYSVLFIILVILQIWNGSNCTIANGMGLLKAQKKFLVFGAIINIPLSYFFVLIYGSWISIVLANILSLLPVCIYQPIYLRKELNKRISLKLG